MNNTNLIVCHTDGACEPMNPKGHGGAGIFIAFDGESFRFSAYLGHGEGMTNNVAELAAVILAMLILIEIGLQNDPIELRSDSRIVMNLMNKRCEKPAYGAYAAHIPQARELLKQFKNIRFVWVPREHAAQQIADELSKEAVKPFLKGSRLGAYRKWTNKK